MALDFCEKGIRLIRRTENNKEETRLTTQGAAASDSLCWEMCKCKCIIYRSLILIINPA